ncbi:hypothetical protein CLSAP_54380 [Clostridium saccharoperbutylacetonicum]|jgi:hypothetical protein|nr:hypothetical protein CLSAP_54370 [Clostridium saccharoperbutylacetonicum]AQR98087.1 hypothetical protein CLSAP_54380 [Clostridium saccharoperbutylacetonicum]NSB33979.1 hypothetical protein [Clostridium saccharoperbutylacetonicum]NSB33980.1 hypothetical protein [Clostridium saccharoperbutylacetonicum]
MKSLNNQENLWIELSVEEFKNIDEYLVGVCY